MRSWPFAALLFCCGGATSQPIVPVVSLPEAGAAANTGADAGLLSRCMAPASADGGIDAYEKAKAFFQDGRYGEAAFVLRPIALDPSLGKVSVYAVPIYLSALNMVTKDHGECIDQMALDIVTLRKAHCSGPDRANPECETLARIDAGIHAAAAHHGLEQATQTGEVAGLERSADGYVELFRTYCADPLLLKNCDEVLYNAAVLYTTANRSDRAREMLAMMKDPKNKLSQSKLTTELECRLGPDAGRCR